MPGEVSQADYLRDSAGRIIGLRNGPQSVPLGATLLDTGSAAPIIVSANAPVNADGRPDGTVWIQTA